MHPRRRLALTAAAVTAAALLTSAPAAASETPEYRSDQIAERVPVGLELAAGETRTMRHAEAVFIKVRLDGVALGERDTVTVASPDGTESHVHDAAEVADGGLWTLSIEGETAAVTLNDVADGTTATARVAEYSRGLNEAELASRPSATGQESICGQDDSQNAVCYKETDPVAYAASRSVARLIIEGESYCTGWFAGHDRMLTNEHCLSTAAQSRSTEVQFGYECAECSGGIVLQPLKISGASVLASDFTHDFTLFTVADPAKIAHLPALEISREPVREHEKIYIPQHSGGKPLRIASTSTSEPAGLGTQCMVSDPDAPGRGWASDFAYLCDTEGGSSGSPVISRETGRVVGMHHFGGCPNQAVRMDLIYPMIAPYVDYDFSGPAR
ncbi:MAG TPA: serine protease [Glycomyces sp.]|nr:serine protease [Glycomyces sp.]